MGKKVQHFGRSSENDGTRTPNAKKLAVERKQARQGKSR